MNLIEELLMLADKWEEHSKLFTSPVDKGTREDWEFVSRTIRELAKKATE